MGKTHTQNRNGVVMLVFRYASPWQLQCSICGRASSFRLRFRLSPVSELHLVVGVRGRVLRASASISSKSSGCAGSLVTRVVVTILISVVPGLHRSSELSLEDGSVTLLLPRRDLVHVFVASTVHSPPNRLGFSIQKAAKVSIAFSSEGGSSLKIIMRRVQVYNSTSSQPFEVMIAPARERRASEGGLPDMDAIRALARGIVQITYTSGYTTMRLAIDRTRLDCSIV